MKDEGEYLSEWIQYHIDRGITKFILYDNESSDDTKSIIEEFQKKGRYRLSLLAGEESTKKKLIMMQ